MRMMVLSMTFVVRMEISSGIFLGPRGGPLWYIDRLISLEIRKIELDAILILR